MSMRLNFAERETIYDALEEHLENVSGENNEEENRTRKLIKRLDNYEKLSFANHAGGNMAEMKARHKLQDRENFIKGWTGKSYEEHVKPVAEQTEPNNKDESK